MTQINAGVSFKGRLPQFVGQAALAASVLAGGASLLNAGGAMAATDTFPLTPFIPPAVENGATITGLTGPTAGGGDVEFTYNGISPVNNRPTWAIDTDFSPNISGTYNGTFTYSVTAPLGQKWLSAALNQNLVSPLFPGATVTKEIFTKYDPVSGILSDPIGTAGPILDTSTSAIIELTKNVDTIYIRDTYTGVPGAQLDNFINTVQTPGPLPILGAGAAFGFSRKLRSRIKAGRTA